MTKFLQAIGVSAMLALAVVAGRAAGRGVETRVTPLPYAIAPAASAPVGRAFFGVHMHRSDRGTSWPAVPFGSWRLWDANVTWADLEPKPGAWDFRRLDRYVAMAAITHTEVVLPLGMTPRWASANPDGPSGYGPGQAAPPVDTNAWREYVDTVARRYKGRVRYFEMWNEVNLTSFYTGSIDRLIELQRVAYAVIKGVDAENRLVSASFTGNTSDEVYKFSNYLRQGGAAAADIVSYHLYSPKVHPEAVVPLVEALRKAMKAAGAEGKPLWDTESGYAIRRDPSRVRPAWMSSDWLQLDEQTGAAFWMIGYALKAQLGVARAFHYSWDGEEIGFVGGRRDASPDTLEALREFVDWVIARTPAGCVFLESHTECRFAGPNRSETALLIWSRDRDRSVTLGAARAGAKGQRFCERGDHEFVVPPDGSVVAKACPIAVMLSGEASSN